MSSKRFICNAARAFLLLVLMLVTDVARADENCMCVVIYETKGTTAFYFSRKAYCNVCGRRCTAGFRRGYRALFLGRLSENDHRGEGNGYPTHNEQHISYHRQPGNGQRMQTTGPLYPRWQVSADSQGQCQRRGNPLYRILEQGCLFSNNRK